MRVRGLPLGFPFGYSFPRPPGAEIRSPRLTAARQRRCVSDRASDAASSPSTLPIRIATLDDVDELVRLRQVMFDEMDHPAGDPAWREACAAFLRETMAAGTTVSLVAGDGDRLVSCGTGVTFRRVPGPANPSGRYGYIQSVVTEAPWRGRGLARAIVAGLLDWYRQRGIHRVDLHATGDGEPIYRSLGFTPDLAYPEMRWNGLA
jgi:GNAT superfamily N-acetyltransferase